MTNRERNVLVAFQKALLGEVSRDLRAVVAVWSDTTIDFDCYFDGPIAASDVDSMARVRADVASRFPAAHRTAHHLHRIDYPFHIPKDRIAIYSRWEAESDLPYVGPVLVNGRIFHTDDLVDMNAALLGPGAPDPLPQEDAIDRETDVRAALQGALVGNVPATLRAVSASCDTNHIHFICVFDGEISDEDADTMLCVDTELVAWYPATHVITHEIRRLDAPAEILVREFPVFLRKER